MARSHHIYLILRPSKHNPVVAAFTVKHECEAFVAHSKDPAKVGWEVRRYRDGGPLVGGAEQGTPVNLSIHTVHTDA